MYSGCTAKRNEQTAKVELIRVQIFHKRTNVRGILEISLEETRLASLSSTYQNSIQYSLFPIK